MQSWSLELETFKCMPSRPPSSHDHHNLEISRYLGYLGTYPLGTVRYLPRYLTTLLLEQAVDSNMADFRLPSMVLEHSSTELPCSTWHNLSSVMNDKDKMNSWDQSVPIYRKIESVNLMCFSKEIQFSNYSTYTQLSNTFACTQTGK